MFSGIIEELGEVATISRTGNVTLLEIKANKVPGDIEIGDSISVNGACLTVVKKERDSLSFEVMAETLKITNLGYLRLRDKVNLERSLKIGDRLSGHFVLGHVDCMGIIRKKNYISNNLCLEITVPQSFIGYVLPKGAICVDGTSLTLVSRKSNSFTVYLIPHTLKNTTLGFKGPSDRVNIEFDILSKQRESPSH